MPILIDLHHDRESELGRSWMETTEIIRELLGKHRDDLSRGIDAGRSSECFSIERTSLSHILTHVCDMDREEVFTFLIPSDTDRIIEIFRISTIDRHREDISEGRSRMLSIGKAWEIFLHSRIKIFSKKSICEIFWDQTFRTLFSDDILVNTLCFLDDFLREVYLHSFLAIEKHLIDMRILHVSYHFLDLPVAIFVVCDCNDISDGISCSGSILHSDGSDIPIFSKDSNMHLPESDLLDSSEYGDIASSDESLH